MWLLVVGLLLFLSAHLSPGVLGLRGPLVGWFGEGRFLAGYIAMSVTGMLCIIAGKFIAPFIHVWTPPAWSRTAALILVALGLILLAALLLPTNLRRLTRHPMLWGITLWSVGHLLANGDVASMILFGGFGGYALISIWSLNRRGAEKSILKYSVLNDVVLLAVGLGVYAALLWLHPYLFGVAAIIL
jgi:uncharacterized membrane protein